MKTILYTIVKLIIFTHKQHQIKNLKILDKSIQSKDNSAQPQNDMQVKPSTNRLIKNMLIKGAIREFPPLTVETFFWAKERGLSVECRIQLLNI